MRLLRRMFIFVKFISYYIGALIMANLRIAYDVITPGLNIKPAFIAIPLRTKTDLEILVYVNLVTMTPGTLSLDVSPDRKFLFIHAMYVYDIEKVRHQLSDDLQERILEVLRC